MPTSDTLAPTASDMETYRQKVEQAAAAVEDHVGDVPSIGILNDLGIDLAPQDDCVDASVALADLPHVPSSTGEVTIRRFGGTNVVLLKQSLHLFEGDTPKDVAFPVRMLGAAGVDTLLVPSVADPVNPQLERGDVMLVTDHMNFQGQNPLVGPNVEAWGPRFPDMTEPYDPELRQVAAQVARDEGQSLQKGVFLGLLGPSPETAAEHRMARRLGADAVGSGVVPEMLAARHMGVKVLAVTVLGERHESDGARAAESGADVEPFIQVRCLLEGLCGHLASEGPA